jgi:hypothetical protein
MKQSRARTFRIEADVDDAIARLAREDRASLSQIANKALKKYVEWDRAPTNRGFVSVPSMLLVRLMAELSEGKAYALGRWAGKELFVPNVMAGYPTMSLERAEKSIKMLGTYGGRFTFDHSVEGGKHVFTIGQKMGRNWSAYYAGAFEVIFERFLGKMIRKTLSENICVIEFKAQPSP